MKVARAKLKEIGPDDVDMEEYKVKGWTLELQGVGIAGASVRGWAVRILCKYCYS